MRLSSRSALRLALALSVLATPVLAVTSGGWASAQVQSLETSYHGNILLRVKGVSFETNSIAVNLEVTNNSPIAINLNTGLPGRGMILVDDLGNQYSLEPPQANRSVAVGQGETLSGTFQFSGRLANGAKSLTLITNVGSGETEITPTIAPKMTIPDIPVS